MIILPYFNNFIMMSTIFFDFRFNDITGLSRTFLKEFKDIFLQIPGQSRAHFNYLEKSSEHSMPTTYLV